MHSALKRGTLHSQGCCCAIWLCNDSAGLSKCSGNLLAFVFFENASQRLQKHGVATRKAYHATRMSKTSKLSTLTVVVSTLKSSCRHLGFLGVRYLLPPFPFLRLLRASCLNNSFIKYAALELQLFPHQLEQYTFSLWTDGRYAPQIDDEFAAMKVVYGLFARDRELSHPGCDELALHN
jgi:hypothetical protein